MHSKERFLYFASIRQRCVASQIGSPQQKNLSEHDDNFHSGGPGFHQTQPHAAWVHCL